MAEHESVGREVVKGVGRLVGHLAAMIVGVILMVIGVAMGTSILMLPFGVPVGFVGLLTFLWGLSGYTPDQT
jgi:hypothetical protein